MPFLTTPTSSRDQQENGHPYAVTNTHPTERSKQTVHSLDEWTDCTEEKGNGSVSCNNGSAVIKYEYQRCLLKYFVILILLIQPYLLP